MTPQKYTDDSITWTIIYRQNTMNSLHEMVHVFKNINISTSIVRFVAILLSHYYYYYCGCHSYGITKRIEIKCTRLILYTKIIINQCLWCFININHWTTTTTKNKARISMNIFISVVWCTFTYYYYHRRTIYIIIIEIWYMVHYIQ